MTVQRKASPRWLPDGCPTWCEYPGVHKDGDRYADRQHTSRPVYVGLTAEEPPMEGEAPHAEVWDDPEFVNTYVIQHYREIGPRVWVGKGEGAEGLHLTLGEAEELANVLIHHVAAARNETMLGQVLDALGGAEE